MGNLGDFATSDGVCFQDAKTFLMWFVSGLHENIAGDFHGGRRAPGACTRQ